MRSLIGTTPVRCIPWNSMWHPGARALVHNGSDAWGGRKTCGGAGGTGVGEARWTCCGGRTAAVGAGRSTDGGDAWQVGTQGPHVLVNISMPVELRVQVGQRGGISPAGGVVEAPEAGLEIADRQGGC